MSKRSENSGVDGTSSTSEGLVSNPLVDEDESQGKPNELGPLEHREQKGGDYSLGNDDNYPVGNDIASIGQNHSQCSDDTNAKVSSTNGISLSNSFSSEQRSSSGTEQAGGLHQNTRQSPQDGSDDPLDSLSGENTNSSSTLEQKEFVSHGSNDREDQMTSQSDPQSRGNNNLIAAEMSNNSYTNKPALQDGSDQEVPLEEDLSRNQNVTWMPQNEQSLCEFTHTITEYSKKRDSGDKKAEYSEVTVDDRGNKWRLIVYVNGNGRASNHHLSLFLQVADADDLPFGWKKAVSYVLTLEHPDGGGLSYAKRNPDKTFKLCPKAIDWGWSQFITSDKIQQEGFVQSDSLVVRASVTVKSSSVKIDADDSELYLKCAVEEGKPEAVQLCLDQGASVNCQFKDDLYTPLHTACSISPADQDSGDDENAKSALNYAASLEGSMKVLELLLQKGADGNACNKWKETPLLIAANNGHKNAVEALLKYKADPALCSEAGWSALTFAAHKGYDEIVALLLSARAPINCRVSEDLSTPLHKACAGSKPGHLNAVKLLLNGGADVHALNKWRETPLLTAANHGQAGAVEALLRAGADPCKCTDTGWSPLSIAAYKGHNDVVKLLLEEGAPTEEADPTLSALLQAATKGLPETVDILLAHGADHTVTTKKGDTALSILVEQNLIDAAVDMVTHYKASIPRCSRDRKKVQKAKLLINLRVKQQRKGVHIGSGDAYNDDSDVTDDGQTSQGEGPIHRGMSGGADDAKKGNQGKKSTKVSAEEQARAAEEALLNQLEMEDAERDKQEKEASKKLAKKRKKKERERQLKKEQEEKRLAEERAEEEKRMKELRAKEDAKKKVEREREAATRKKQEEEFRRKREEEIRKQQKEERVRKLKNFEDEKTKGRQSSTSTASSPANGRHVKQENKKDVRAKSGTPKGQRLSKQVEATSRSTSQVPTKPKAANTLKKRGWESLPSTAGPAIPSPTQLNQRTNANPLLSGIANKQMDAGAVSLDADSVRAPLEDAAKLYAGTGLSTPKSVAGDEVPPRGETFSTLLEPPAVAVFRREKMLELLHRCSLARLSNDVLGAVDDTIVRIVLLRWITRACHEDSECFDILIPSWVDGEKLSSFFQRQFITESRKRITSGQSPSMESLKSAGAEMASFCRSLAKNVLEFRRQMEQRLPKEWNDMSVGMSSSEIIRTIGNPSVIVDWSKQSQIHLPISVFIALKDRYRGSPSRLLSSIFTSKVCYDTVLLLSGDCSMDYRLLATTKSQLSIHLQIDSEIWSDPFSVVAKNRFWSRLPDVDRVFGGLNSFGTSEGSDQSLSLRGGSVLLSVPPDNLIAAAYIRRSVELLSGTAVPLSFAFFLRPDCLVERTSSFNIDDLYTLDQRLREKVDLISRVEHLPAGAHSYFSDKLGAPTPSSSGSLFVVLQNPSGRNRYPVSDAVVNEILNSMKFDLHPQHETPMNVPLAFSESGESSYNSNNRSLWGAAPDYMDPTATLIPASPLAHQTPVGARATSMTPTSTSVSATFPSNNSPTGQRRSVPRRGRLFDLVDDGGEEDNMTDVVSGMLGTLNVDLFQNTGVQDVDIEAISLMGIGGPSGSTQHTLQPRGSSSHGRFG